jgi:hypothetical protein
MPLKAAQTRTIAALPTVKLSVIRETLTPPTMNALTHPLPAAQAKNHYVLLMTLLNTVHPFAAPPQKITAQLMASATLNKNAAVLTQKCTPAWVPTRVKPKTVSPNKMTENMKSAVIPQTDTSGVISGNPVSQLKIAAIRTKYGVITSTNVSQMIMRHSVLLDVSTQILMTPFFA